MKHIIEMYDDAYINNGDNPASVLCPKGRQRERFNILTQDFENNEGSVLDFGCGLAHMRPFFKDVFPALNYSGYDVNEKFIEVNKIKYSDDDFIRIGFEDIPNERFDYIISSGVFNLKYHDKYYDNQRYVFSRIEELFSLCNQSLSVDFMTDKVDYTQDMAFHLNLVEFLSFVQSRLSGKFKVDCCTFDYEATVVIYK